MLELKIKERILRSEVRWLVADVHVPLLECGLTRGQIIKRVQEGLRLLLVYKGGQLVPLGRTGWRRVGGPVARQGLLRGWIGSWVVAGLGLGYWYKPVA